jgi:FMN phosphatase YigB (HAD superfamily)
MDVKSWFTINPGTIALIKQLKERDFRLLILSNMNEEGKNYLLGPARTLDGEDWIVLFDEVLLSCDLGLLKPEKEIYRACLDVANAKPEECLFIDDMAANVEAARDCGIKAAVFTSADALESALRNEYGLL